MMDLDSDKVVYHQPTPQIDVYRVQGRWTPYKQFSRLLGRPEVREYYRPKHVWSRTWQAEWDGCKRAPRAYTKRGVERKAERAIQAWMNNW